MKGNISSFTFTSFAVGIITLMFVLSPFSLGQNSIDKRNGTPAGWSDNIPLCDYTVTNQYCSIVSNGNEIYVIWRHNYTDLVFSKSIDGGKTWSIYTSIYNNIAGTVLYSDIGVSEQSVHIVVEDFQGWDGLYYKNSINGGETWNNIHRINSDGVDATGPSIFVNNSNIHVIWLDLRASDQEMYYRRSLDGGITFNNGQGIDEDRRLTFSSMDVSYPTMAGDKSNISVLWCDESSGGDWDIYWMISKDNGYTWENGLGVQNIGRMLTGDSTNSIDPAIAVSGSNIHILWVDEQWPGPVYRLYYRNSTDNGITWNPIQLLTGPVPGINSPDIDVQDNNISVVWDDERDDETHEQIYYKNSSDGGITWSTDTRLNFNLSRSSYWPRISIESDTKHVVWWDQIANPNHQIIYKRSPDFPDTSPPSHSNEIPIPDSYKDAPGTNISVHVIDPSGVNESTIQLRVNGSPVSHSLAPITDGYNVSWVSGGFGPGVVTCRIVAEDNLGNVLDYTWNFTVLATYNVPLFPGWNLVSLPLEQIDTSPQTILGSIAGQYDVLKYYNALDKSDPWKTYRPGSPMNDFTNIDNTMGFWIYITEPNVNLTVRGIIPTYTTIPLYAGWNLVGYPTQTTDTVANALWGTGADRVEVFDSASPYVKEAEPTYIMKPGEGYWVHVPADTIWTVNW